MSFSIKPATPTFSVIDNGGTYSGSSYPATATVAGVDSVYGSTLENTGLSLDYRQVNPHGGTTDLGSTAPADAGSYTVVASFAGSADYATGSSAALPFTVTPATLTGVSVKAVNIIYGTVLANSQLSGTASVAGSFSYTSAAGTLLTAGNGHSEAVTFTPTNADYTTAASTVTVNVSRATPTVTVNPVNIIYGTALANSQLSGTANWTVNGRLVSVLGTFTYTSVAGTVLKTGNGQSEAVTFTPADSTDYTTVSASVAINVTVGGILVLDPKASGALTLSGNATITETGAIVVDSSSSTALVASGYARVTANSIRIVGGLTKSGSAVVLSPTPIIHSAGLADPLLALAAPAAPTVSKSLGAVSLGGSSSRTINPGVYSQINVYGNAHLTFNPGTYEIAGGGLLVSGSANVTLNAGIYEIAGGGFNVSGNGVVSGSGVLIYNAGSSFPKAGGGFGSINLSGNSRVTLTGPATGPYAGIVIFQSRDNKASLLLSSNAMLGTGTVYAPSAVLYLTGSSNLSGPLIVDQLWLAGHADPSPVLPEQMAASTDGQGPPIAPPVAPTSIVRSSALVDVSGEGTTLPRAVATIERLPSETIFSAASIFLTSPTVFSGSGPILMVPVAGWSEPLSGGATGHSRSALLSTHDRLFDSRAPGDEMGPWWARPGGVSRAAQPEPALAPALQEIADETAVALRPPPGRVAGAAAVDAAIASLEPTQPKRSDSPSKAAFAGWRDGRAVDRIAAWVAGLALFGWHQTRTGREEQDDWRPIPAVRLRRSSRS